MIKRICKLVSLILIIALCFNITAFAYNSDTHINAVTGETEQSQKPDQRTGGVIQTYSETGIGPSSEYNQLVTEYNGDIYTSVTVGMAVLSIITAGIGPLVGVTSISQNVAIAIIQNALGLGINYLDNIYYHYREYGHYRDTWSYRQVIVSYYADSAHSIWLGESVSYYNQYWY